MSTNNFLNLTVLKQANEIKTNACITAAANNSTEQNEFENVDITSKGQNMDLCGNLTDEEIVAYMDNLAAANQVTEVEEEPEQEPQISVDDSNIRQIEMSDSATPTTAQIKTAIFNYRHPEFAFDVYSNGNSGRDFDKLASALGITPTSGITKKSLIAFTQNDAKEDANADFYGMLNRAFSNKDNNYVITYKDLQYLCVRMAGKSTASGNSNTEITLDEYKAVVNEYAQATQNEFSKKSAQGKLEFAIQKAYEYFDAVGEGMELQKKALDRLTKETTDTYNASNSNKVAAVGQIVFLSNMDNNTGGAYTPNAHAWDSMNPDGSTGGSYTIFGFHSDDDTQDLDLGMSLNSNFLSGYWYDVVQILIHELTHATACFYDNCTTTNDGCTISVRQEGYDELVSRGILTTKPQNMYEYLYLATTMYDEYSAYIQSADYLDSIGEDMYSEIGSNGKYTFEYSSWDNLAVSGDKEWAAIKSHVSSNYENAETKPVITDPSKYKAYYNKNA